MFLLEKFAEIIIWVDCIYDIVGDHECGDIVGNELVHMGMVFI